MIKQVEKKHIGDCKVLKQILADDGWDIPLHDIEEIWKLRSAASKVDWLEIGWSRALALSEFKEYIEQYYHPIIEELFPEEI